MANSESTIKFSIENLTALAARLGRHADDTLARRDAERDFRLAAQACDRLCFLRGRIAEIAQQALDRPQWDAAAFARDIREALDQAEEGDV
jgi:hypothetical protein